MSTTFAVTPPAPGLQLIGPLEHNKVVIDGYTVPMLNGWHKDGKWHFALDNSCSIEVPDELGHPVAWMIANALALGAGYSCFGEKSQPLNPFARRAFYLGIAPEIETMETQGGEQ